jgi:hypothetical protein
MQIHLSQSTEYWTLLQAILLATMLREIALMLEKKVATTRATAWAMARVTARATAWAMAWATARSLRLSMGLVERSALASRRHQCEQRLVAPKL